MASDKQPLRTNHVLVDKLTLSLLKISHYLPFNVYRVPLLRRLFSWAHKRQTDSSHIRAWNDQ